MVDDRDTTWSAPERREITGVIDCRPLDLPTATDLSLADLQRAQQTGVLGAFHLVRALADSPGRVWFVTRSEHGSGGSAADRLRSCREQRASLPLRDD
jgi:hypothetical protein